MKINEFKNWLQGVDDALGGQVPTIKVWGRIKEEVNKLGEEDSPAKDPGSSSGTPSSLADTLEKIYRDIEEIAKERESKPGYEFPKIPDYKDGYGYPWWPSDYRSPWTGDPFPGLHTTTGDTKDLPKSGTTAEPGFGSGDFLYGIVATIGDPKQVH